MQTLDTAQAGEITDQARRAVAVFRSMQPGLSAFARALTGRRNVRVEVSAGIPRTDGDRILYRPPLALGAGYAHERSACDRRDEDTGLQLCLACRVEEEVYANIFHEIAHIAYGTFEKTKDDQNALQQGVELSPFLPTIINCLEDCRIDQKMFDARRGTKAMFTATTIAMFRDGSQAADGTMIKWSDAALNAQVMVGLFCIGSDYDYTGWFHPDVETALGDKTLTELAEKASHSKSIKAIYDLSILVWNRLRELGFCKVNDDDMPDTPEEETSDDSEPDSTDDLDSTSDDPDTDTTDSTPDAPTPDEVQEENEVEDEPSDDTTDDLGSPESPEQTGSSDRGEEEDSDGGEESDVPLSEDGSDSDTEPSESDTSTGDSDAVELDEDDAPQEEGQADSSEPTPEDEPGPDETGQSERDAERENGSEDQPEDSGTEDQARSDSPGEGGEEGSESVPDSSDTGTGQSGSTPQDRPSPSGSPSVDDRPLDDEPAESSSGGEDRQEGGDQDDRDSDGETGLPEGGSGTESGGSDLAPDEAGSVHDDLSGQLDQVQGAVQDQAESGQPDQSDDPVSEGGNLVDTGADKGEGGIQTDARPSMGSAEDIAGVLDAILGHGEIHAGELSDEGEEAAHALDIAVMQGEYFETPSVEVMSVKIYKNGEGGEGWTGQRRRRYAYDADENLEVPESILGPALLQTRRTFDDNKRSTYDRNRKSGRIHGASLAKRAPFKDERMFGKRNIARKKSYAVIIGIDVSGSTQGVNLHLAKRAAIAQAELCHRAGIDFAVYCHSSDWYANQDGTQLDIYEIKAFNAPWTKIERGYLEKIGSCSGNLDGHSIEYYRKMIERVDATNKIILYYSDGKMPAENHDEELMILQREIKYCKRNRIELMGVGIRTDSPKRHGLDTVQVDTDDDLVKVVRHLGKKLNAADRK